MSVNSLLRGQMLVNSNKWKWPCLANRTTSSSRNRRHQIFTNTARAKERPADSADLLNQLLRVAAAGWTIYRIQMPTLWPRCSHRMTAPYTPVKQLRINPCRFPQPQHTNTGTSALILETGVCAAFVLWLYCLCHTPWQCKIYHLLYY